MSSRALFSVWLLVLSICSPAVAAQDSAQVFHYHCEHFLLGSLGELTLEIQALDEERTQISVTGEALGMMALLDGNRQQHYVSIVRSDRAHQIVPLRHQQLTHIDSRGRRIHYGWLLTFTGLQVTAQRLWGGQVVESHVTELPAGAYGDLLSILLAFQRSAEPLSVAQVFTYSLFTLQGIGQIDVRVEACEEQQDLLGSTGRLWRCRVTSSGGRLPGNCSALTLWCDDHRQVVKAEAPFVWGLGTVVIRKTSESL